ncbi:hypothetical protein EXU57_23285 [Segetibacter sp. 3557_3]|uniref:hypothetical protein n=1 Tax=Segetibacter sp. 3557_3 TaxID=2547429 RepID=UPI001058A56B|nr:hypothetical protein [Segetibacter sp. 3557_3]TDH18390.1 hypothetical protein EXU57_23285 [Segetibacter sp. 3557_3]
MDEDSLTSSAEQRSAAYKKVSGLKVEIDLLKLKEDSLYRIYVNDFIEYKRINLLNFGKQRSRAFFDMVYANGGNRFRALTNAGVSFGNNSGSLFSEIVSGNLSFVRVSLGTMISNSNQADETKEKHEEAY